MNNLKRWSFLFLVGLIAFQLGCRKGGPPAIPQDTYVIQSPVTQRIVDSSNLIARVFHDTVFQVVDGVQETDIHYLSNEGYSMRVFILRVDMNTPTIKLEAGLPDGFSSITGNMQPLPEIAEYLDSNRHHVVGG